MSKGSGRRLKQVSNQEYKDNWNKIFKKSTTLKGIDKDGKSNRQAKVIQ